MQTLKLSHYSYVCGGNIFHSYSTLVNQVDRRDKSYKKYSKPYAAMHAYYVAGLDGFPNGMQALLNASDGEIAIYKYSDRKWHMNHIPKDRQSQELVKQCVETIIATALSIGIFSIF
ncbi:MAG: hypothetical protein FJ161_03315 [Gammaproteobacteria bacterium]|nr:hypothetical protein [Gammaproteobacteria bacterium]